MYISEFKVQQFEVFFYYGDVWFWTLMFEFGFWFIQNLTFFF